MYTPIRRIGRPASRVARGTPRTPADGVLVAELEFEGGPLDGRCLTGLTCLGDLHVIAGPNGAPRLAGAGPRRTRLGTYRHDRTYDCPRRVERVCVYRWVPAGRIG